MPPKGSTLVLLGLFSFQITSSVPVIRAVSYCDFLHTQIVLLYSVCASDDKGVWSAACGVMCA